MIIRILKILFASSFFSTALFAQISPGDLTFAHESLEGISNCTKCHILGEKVDNQKCLDCHTKISELINSNRGYHSSSEVENENCFKCHGEHFGREFTIIRFDENKFDHSLTIFPLKGKHEETKCESCHQSKFIKSEELKNKNSTYLGLETNCQNCHEDYHQETFTNSACSSCHNFEKWRPAVGFDHANAKFKLSGAHENIKCEECHKISERNGKEFQNFSVSKFNKCIDCHKDIHLGKFGVNCIECHTVQAFNSITNRNKFDHTKTDFKLSGAHINVKCQQCHAKGVSVKLKYQKCYDCHTDYHKGEFKENGIEKDCSKCHSEETFTPSHFTFEDHSKTKFSLVGRHLAVPCNRCHYSNSRWEFTSIATGCEKCHNNIHGDLILKYRSEKGLCEICHNSNSWKQINFDHEKTEFKLIGKHTITKCIDCHFSDEQQSSLFHKLTTSCQDCHKDIHSGQFMDNYQNNCSKCHNPNNWNVENFDHNQTRFKLDGSHIKLSCNKCHKSEIIDREKIVNYKFKEISCKTCHS